MRSKHPSDDAFETWVDGADQLRTHSVQAAFRQGWSSGQDHEARSCPHTGDLADARATIERLTACIENLRTDCDQQATYAKGAIGDVYERISNDLTDILNAPALASAPAPDTGGGERALDPMACNCRSWAYDPVTHGPNLTKPNGHHPLCFDDRPR